jgi:hypothetical protein
MYPLLFLMLFNSFVVISAYIYPEYKYKNHSRKSSQERVKCVCNTFNLLTKSKKNFTLFLSIKTNEMDGKNVVFRKSKSSINRSGMNGLAICYL